MAYPKHRATLSRSPFVEANRQRRDERPDEGTMVSAVDTTAYIDWYLELSFAEWQEFREVASDSVGIPSDEYVAYIEELPLFDEHLLALRRMFNEGKMTKAQKAKFEDLLRLVDELRPRWKHLLQI
jgi:hypothetical protein